LEAKQDANFISDSGGEGVISHGEKKSMAIDCTREKVIGLEIAQHQYKEVLTEWFFTHWTS